MWTWEHSFDDDKSSESLGFRQGRKVSSVLCFDRSTELAIIYRLADSSAVSFMLTTYIFIHTDIIVIYLKNQNIIGLSWASFSTGNTARSERMWVHRLWPVAGPCCNIRATGKQNVNIIQQTWRHPTLLHERREGHVKNVKISQFFIIMGIYIFYRGPSCDKCTCLQPRVYKTARMAFLGSQLDVTHLYKVPLVDVSSLM